MNRRAFLTHVLQFAAWASLSGCTSLAAPPSRIKKRFVMDGLSFLPEALRDVHASELNAFIADVSAIEQIENPDGSINYKRTYQACIASIKSSLETVTNNAGTYRLIKTASDMDSLGEQCGVLFQIQGADCVEVGIDKLDEFYDLGLRALQLTHHYDNAFAGGAISNKRTGLTQQGQQLVKKLEAKSMLIDLSHSTEETALDTLQLSKAPIIQSHGAASAIVNNARCSSDKVIKGIADSGGVFGVFMMSWWLTTDKVPTPKHYIDHIKHVVKVGGIEAVGIANDYPLAGHQAALLSGNNNEIAINGYKEWWQAQGKRGVPGFDRDVSHIVIPELNHIKRMRSIERFLDEAGFNGREIDLIMGRNWQRVIKDVLA